MHYLLLLLCQMKCIFQTKWIFFLFPLSRENHQKTYTVMLPSTDAKFPPSHLSIVSCWKERRIMKHHHGNATFLNCCTFNEETFCLIFNTIVTLGKCDRAITWLTLRKHSIFQISNCCHWTQPQVPLSSLWTRLLPLSVSVRGLISSFDDKYNVSKFSVNLYKKEVTSENGHMLSTIIYLISHRRKPRLEVFHQHPVHLSNCRSGATYDLLSAAKLWLGPEVQAFFLLAAF